MSTGETKTAAIYLRISADPAGERAGVQRQRTECEAMAQRLGLDVVGVFEDNDTSAYSGKPRPEFERLLKAAANGDFTHVLAWASDRLYRRLSDLVRITDELAPHATIHTVVGGEVDLTNAEGIMRAQVLGSVAEFESRRKGERLRARAKQRAESGTMTASIRPTGWRWADPCPGDETCHHRTRCEQGQRPRAGSRAGLLLDPHEAPILADAYRAVRDGRSLAWAWRQANTDGLELADPTCLRSALLNPRNAGLVAHKGAVVAQAADGAALIDKDTYEAVKTILNDPDRRTSPSSPTSPPLGGGLAVCPHCGGNLAAGRKTGSPTYVCSRHLHYTKRRHLLDGPVLDLVGQVLSEAARAGLLTLAAGDDEQVKALRDDIASRESRLETLAAMMASGDLDPADYAMASKKLRAALGELTARLSRRSARPAVAQLAADAEGVGAAYRRLREQADEGDVDGLRALLADVLARITPRPDGSTTLEWQPWVGPAPAVIDAPTPPRPDQAARRAKVKEMHAEGKTINAIASDLGVNRCTIRKDLRALAGAA